jgi:hypothetical protein
MRQQGRRHSDDNYLCLAVQCCRAVEVVQLLVGTWPDSVRGALVGRGAGAASRGARSHVRRTVAGRRAVPRRPAPAVGPGHVSLGGAPPALRRPRIRGVASGGAIPRGSVDFVGSGEVGQGLSAAAFDSAWFRHAVDVVRYLVGCWPGSIYERTSDGSLPLHLALESRRPDMATLRFLLEQWPGSIQEAGDRGMLPLQLAAARDAPLDVVHFLASTWPGAVCQGMPHKKRPRLSVC